MNYKILGFVLLVLFYIIYFGKMYAQSKKGIKTNQMIHGNKDKKLKFQEFTMKLITFLVIIIEVLSILLNWSILNNTFRSVGVVIGIISILVFFLSVYTMKDSWRAGITDDETELITNGIYKYSRNPAFLGFYLIYISILLMFFNYLLLVVSLLAIVSLHLQVLQEEKSLESIFNKEYNKYRKKVYRYLGKRK